MYIDFASDWSAYLFMALFVIFFVYVIVKGNSKQESTESKTSK
jgi:integral membrane sensor domain MASE1